MMGAQYAQQVQIHVPHPMSSSAYAPSSLLPTDAAQRQKRPTTAHRGQHQHHHSPGLLRETQARRASARPRYRTAMYDAKQLTTHLEEKIFETLAKRKGHGSSTAEALFDTCLPWPMGAEGRFTTVAHAVGVGGVIPSQALPHGALDTSPPSQSALFVQQLSHAHSASHLMPIVTQREFSSAPPPHFGNPHPSVAENEAGGSAFDTSAAQWATHTHGTIGDADGSTASLGLANAGGGLRVRDGSGPDRPRTGKYAFLPVHPTGHLTEEELQAYRRFEISLARSHERLHGSPLHQRWNVLALWLDSRCENVAVREMKQVAVEIWRQLTTMPHSSLIVDSDGEQSPSSGHPTGFRTAVAFLLLEQILHVVAHAHPEIERITTLIRDELLLAVYISGDSLQVALSASFAPLRDPTDIEEQRRLISRYYGKTFFQGVRALSTKLHASSLKYENAERTKEKQMRLMDRIASYWQRRVCSMMFYAWKGHVAKRKVDHALCRRNEELELRVAELERRLAALGKQHACSSPPRVSSPYVAARVVVVVASVGETSTTENGTLETTTLDMEDPRNNSEVGEGTNVGGATGGRSSSASPAV